MTDSNEEQKIKYGKQAKVSHQKNADDSDNSENVEKKPLQIDILIKKNKDVAIDNEIGRIFKTYNILEYKSPKDGLNIDDYYKTMAYACLYKSLGEHVNQIPASDVTVSLFREDFPRGLFRELEKQQSVIEQKFPGIYYISGAGTLFDAQIVVTSELRKEGHSSLRILSRDVNEEDIAKFASDIEAMSTQGDKNNIDAVLQVSFAANKNIYKKFKEDSYMADSTFFREYFADEIKEQYSSGLNVGIQRSMERGMQRGLEQGSRQTVYSLVQDGYITPEVGAMKLNTTVEQLKANMINTGYKYPES